MAVQALLARAGSSDHERDRAWFFQSFGPRPTPDTGVAAASPSLG